MSYYDKETKFTENLACEILNNIGIKNYLNNLVSITDVDIKTESGLKIDVQFSKNFAKYGDYRLDIISAYSHNCVENKMNNFSYDENISFTSNFEYKYNCTVNKVGKLFQKDYLDALIILFYNGVKINKKPDYILIIKKDDLISYLKVNKKTLFNEIKINNKIGLQDKHGSAFIPINAKSLHLNTGCFFGTVGELLIQKEEIKSYLLDKKL